MASAERFSLFPCAFVHAGGTLNLTQMDGFDVKGNSRKNAIIPGGAVDRAHIGIASAAPSATFNTRDLTTLFTDVSGSAGLAISGAATFRLQERSNSSTFETGATHETFTAASGFLYPTSISASQDGEDGASCSCEFVPHWDGSTNPFVHNTGVNFDAVNAPAFVSRFFLGPVYSNTTQIAGVVSINVDFGITYDARPFNGAPYASLGAIIKREPTLSITVAKIDTLSALTMFGNAVDTSFSIYLQKGVASGTRVAGATSTHCKISCTAGDMTNDSVSVTGNDDGTATLTVMPTTVVAVSVASAIP